MPALDFPASPATGQTFAAGNGVVYTFNGTVWLASGASAGGDFYATGAGGAISTGGPAVIFPGSVVTGNSGGWYSTSTGRFTPPAGRYCIFTNVYVTAGGAAAGVFVYLHKNGSQIPNNAAANSIGASAAGSFALDAIVDANGTDYFDVRATAFAAATASVMGFGGFPISGIKGPPGDPYSMTQVGGDFCAYSTVATGITGATLIPLTIISGNSGGWYSTSTGRYTPPAGRYHISAQLSATSTGSANVGVVLRKNAVTVAEGRDTSPAASTLANPTVDVVVDANGTDWFDIQGVTGGTSTVAYLTFTAYPISGIKGPPGDPGTPLAQNAQTGSYTLVLGDANGHLYHAVAAATATYTIPANASVAYPIGTTLSFVNDSTNAVTIAITTDTLVLSPGTTTGSRTLATGGVATALKVTSTRWVINGTGLT